MMSDGLEDDLIEIQVISTTVKVEPVGPILCEVVSVGPPRDFASKAAGN